MQITFITLTQALLTATVLTFVVWAYFRWVRPEIEDTWAFHGFHGKVVPWLKARWDIVASFVVAMAPIVWNGGLDLIIFLALLLADVVPVLAGMDLSALVIPAEYKIWIQIAGAIITPARALWLQRKKTEG